MATETSDQVGSFRRTGRVPARARVPGLISSHAPRGVRRPARPGGSPSIFTCGRRDTPTSRPSPSPWKPRRRLRVGGSPAGVPTARPLNSCEAVAVTTQEGLIISFNFACSVSGARGSGRGGRDGLGVRRPPT